MNDSRTTCLCPNVAAVSVSIKGDEKGSPCFVCRKSEGFIVLSQFGQVTNDIFYGESKLTGLKLQNGETVLWIFLE